jgi:phosphate uptake regulator
MSNHRESKLPNADMQAAPRALRRAADHAREIARRTGTKLVIIRNGVLMEVDPDDAELDRESGQDE